MLPPVQIHASRRRLRLIRGLEVARMKQPIGIENRQRALLYFIGALFLGFCSFYMNALAAAPSDDSAFVIAAILGSASAVFLLALSWRWMGNMLRVAAFLLAIPTFWTLFDAAIRKLPAAFDW